MANCGYLPYTAVCMMYGQQAGLMVVLLPVPKGGVTWPKSIISLSHHMRWVPHSTALSRWFYHPFSLAKPSKITTKREKIPFQNHFLVVDLWKHPIFLDVTLQVQLVKNAPKTWKWLSILVDFGQASPLPWYQLCGIYTRWSTRLVTFIFHCIEI